MGLCALLCRKLARCRRPAAVRLGRLATCEVRVGPRKGHCHRPHKVSRLDLEHANKHPPAPPLPCPRGHTGAFATRSGGESSACWTGPPPPPGSDAGAPGVEQVLRGGGQWACTETMMAQVPQQRLIHVLRMGHSMSDVCDPNNIRSMTQRSASRRRLHRQVPRLVQVLRRDCFIPGRL